MDRETCDEEVIDANDLMDKPLVHQKAKAKLHHRVNGHVWRGGKEAQILKACCSPGVHVDVQLLSCI